MNIEKIEINGYYVWVDKDAEIKEGDYLYSFSNTKIVVANKQTDLYIHSKKIIAASPELNLEGIPTYVDWLAEQEYPNWKYTDVDELRDAFIKGNQTAEKKLQKQLITEIMNEDDKDGLYEPQPTWEDVRQAIEMAREEIIRYRDNGWGVSEAHKLGYKMKEEEIIEQLKQSKK